MRSGLITHADKVLFAERGETKGDLAEHYLRVTEPLMRTMGGRPVLLQRFPEGAAGPVLLPEAGARRTPRTGCRPPRCRRRTAPRHRRWSPPTWTTCCGRSTWAVSASTSGPIWPTTRTTPTNCGSTSTRPRAWTSPTSARPPTSCALLLAELGVVGYPKTTGNRGLHVYVRLQPRWDSYQVRSAAVAVARELERRRPDLITAAWWKEERGQRVFVDFNQNAPHKTVFGAWSVRARPGAQVSTPIAWAEIDDIHPDQFTIASWPPGSRPCGDPWLGMNDAPAVAGAAAGDARAGPGERVARRAVAAGLSETAGRAAPGRSQPREEVLTSPTPGGPGPGAPAATRRGRRRPGPGRPRRSC